MEDVETKEKRDNKSDSELYEEFLLGNNLAFNELVKKYRKPLIAFIYKYVNQLDIAEDLSQDTFVYLLMNKNSYNSKYSLKSYLFMIAKCRSINFFKKAKKNLNSYNNEISLLEDSFDLDENLLKDDQKQKIHSAIKKLKKEYQIAIFLKDIQEFEYSEISQILNKTIPQTRLLLHRARKSLAKILKKEVK